MRGVFQDQGSMFSYVLPERRIPADHPLRPIRELVRDILNQLNRSLRRLYSSEGRPSIPPEQLLSVRYSAPRRLRFGREKGADIAVATPGIGMGSAHLRHDRSAKARRAYACEPDSGHHDQA